MPSTMASFFLLFFRTAAFVQRIVLLGRHFILHQSQCNLSQDRTRYVLFKENGTTNILKCLQLVYIVERASRKHCQNAVGSLCRPLLFGGQEEGGGNNKKRRQIIILYYYIYYYIYENY